MTTFLNAELGIYPDINDPDFEDVISSKKEFYDNNIINRHKDVYCLEPQQRFLSNYINPLTLYNSLLVYHSVGVGKTLTAISIAENFKNDYNILVIVKNEALQLNFIKELTGICSNYFKNKEEYKIFHDPTHEKHIVIKNKVNKEIMTNYSFITYGNLVSKVIGRKIKLINKNIQRDQKNIYLGSGKADNTVIIIDEVHNVTGNDTYDAIMTLIKNSKNIKVILLSATPVFDNIKEIFEIANLLGSDLPIRNELVKNNLITETVSNNNLLIKNNTYVLTPKGKNIITKNLKGKVSYLLPDTELFPKRIYMGTPISNIQGSINISRCVMSSFQEKVYISTHSLDTTNNLFMSSSNALTMVYPNMEFGKKGFINNIVKSKDRNFLKEENIKKYSCKLYNILINIKKSSGPCFIYSEFVNFGGTSLIKEVLIANGYSIYGSRNNKPKFITIDGNISPKQQQNLLRLFNSNINKNGEQIKIIIGSPIVSEGITFKNIRQIHILDPHWNLSKIEQIIGRGVRFKSHQALPLNERKVEIFLHTAISNKNEDISIDYLKYKLSEEKDISIKEIEWIIKKIAVDCSLNKSRNVLKSSLDNSRECQYKKCDYSCSNKNHKQVDESTYSIIKHDKELYNFILEKIKELYKIGFVYKLQDIINYIKGKTTLNINKRNIYYVLDNVINTPIYLNNALSIKSFIIAYEDYYIIHPVENDVLSESFFNKIYKKINKAKNLNEVLNIKVNETKGKKTKKTIVKIDPEIIKQKIYGSYIDKLGNKDDKFRIIDNRVNTTNISDKRKITTGKVCTFYSKTELKEISDYLKLSITEKLSKEEYCESIQKFLEKNKKVIK